MNYETMTREELEARLDIVESDIFDVKMYDRLTNDLWDRLHKLQDEEATIRAILRTR